MEIWLNDVYDGGFSNLENQLLNDMGVSKNRDTRDTPKWMVYN